MPNFFWDSEPTLHPLYAAIREYLEIDPRIKVLNERCRVFLDLAEILSDSVADAKMSAITWIVIILIIVSILVTVTEVGLRFAMLERSSRNNDEGPKSNGSNAASSAISWSAPPSEHVVLVSPSPHRRDVPEAQARDRGLSDLEILAMALGLQPNATVSELEHGIWALKRDSACTGGTESHHEI